jgi:NitT/TauT family transport system substrate-binding protein
VRFLTVAAVAFLVAACGGSPQPSPSGIVPLKVGLGFIPSVQFAQFYYARQQGYYSAAGLDVTLENKIDPELITLIGQGAIDVGLADGTSVIPAVGQHIPVKYVAAIYAQFPSVVIAKASSGINAPADLKGKTLGIPGKYGSSWIMLQALLVSAGLTPNDLTIKLYPDYGQATALAAGQVDAATGFVNNEPVVLARQGIPTTVLAVDAITPLPGPGLVTGSATLATKAEPLKAFVAATLRAMKEIQADPQKGVDATFAVAPDLKSDPAGQRAILDATIATWSNGYVAAHGLGAINPDAWARSVAFMRGLPDSGVTRDIPVNELIDTTLVPAT